MKLVTWRFWAFFTALTGTWAALGPVYDTNSGVLEWMARIGIIGVPIVALIFIGIYTVLGLRGAAKWWRTNFGLQIVLFPLAMAVQSATVAWALLFNHGSITGSIPAWLYVGGHLAGLLLLAWGCVLWLRAGTTHTKGTTDDQG